MDSITTFPIPMLLQNKAYPSCPKWSCRVLFEDGDIGQPGSLYSVGLVRACYSLPIVRQLTTIQQQNSSIDCAQHTMLL